VKKVKLLFLGLLLATAVVLTGCNLEGVAGFAPGSGRVALIRESSSLYTTNATGGQTATIAGGDLLASFGASFSPDGSQIVFVNADRELCTANAGGGGRNCPTSLPAEAGAGLLSYLPNGHVIVVYQSGSRFNMRIYNPAWNIVRQEDNLDQFFLTPNAYKVKRGSQGVEWYMTPHQPGVQSLRWVVTRGQDAFMYVATPEGVAMHNPLPISISGSVQTALAQRNLQDITSGAVSPDGRALVFRTGSDSSLYSLYMLDLTPAARPLELLVEGANFRIEYAFSPDGRELAYESNVGGRSVWLIGSDGANERQLASGASLPDWR
jgi:WD40 repeat protein